MIVNIGFARPWIWCDHQHIPTANPERHIPVKKVILAPAVALAVAGFGAAPVVLAPAAFAETVAEPTVTVATAELTQEESAAGAGLLVIGAATVLLTRRRGAKTGPADI